jgi:hypothetical protein
VFISSSQASALSCVRELGCVRIAGENFRGFPGLSLPCELSGSHGYEYDGFAEYSALYLTEVDRRLGGAHCLHTGATTRNMPSSGRYQHLSNSLEFTIHTITAYLPDGRGSKAPLKRPSISTTQQGVTSQKTFTFTDQILLVNLTKIRASLVNK